MLDDDALQVAWSVRQHPIAESFHLARPAAHEFQVVEDDHEVASSLFCAGPVPGRPGGVNGSAYKCVRSL